MESGKSELCESCSDFGFGFNDANFSDRTLLIELIHDPIKLHTGHKAIKINGNQIKTIHINSLILAGKSPFFHKLFSNGMSESNQRHATLSIQELEEAAFMDLLKFMYTSKLSGTTHSALLDVLVIADKYEVASCVKYCFQLLHKLPMTCESALFCLDLPSTNLMNGIARRLTDAAKEFLIACFKDISKFSEEMLNLPLAGIEVVLSSDNLQVDSEDEIYDIVMKWSQRNYTEPGERRDMLTTHLLSLIRFPYMSRSKLEEVLTCTDITLEHRSKLVFDAISLETPHRQLPPVKERERAYKLRPVKVIRFDSPRKVCKAYFDLKYEECARLLPSCKIYSQNFDLAGQEFYLIVEHYVHKNSFLFSLGMANNGSLNGPMRVECEFSQRKKPSERFVGIDKLDYEFAESYSYIHGYPGEFGVPWKTFMADDSPYFINGILHLRAVIRIKKQE